MARPLAWRVKIEDASLTYRLALGSKWLWLANDCVKVLLQQAGCAGDDASLSHVLFFGAHSFVD